ncbi:MAG: hypothetical protein JXL81_04035 [Deltaproteobacteria bacterium]|nr:hypothetical protein [Deltaproteobacteria bacterium]
MDCIGYFNSRLFHRIYETGIFLFFITCLLLLNASYSLAEIHVSNEFTYTYNNITGPGKSQSSLTDGHSYLDVLGVSGNGEFRSFDYNFNIGAQFTDDRRTDPQSFLLTNLKAGITNGVHTVTLGDTFRAFSQYSLSTSLKGGLYSFRQEDSGLPQFDLIYGYAHPRWDNFHGMWDSHIDTIKREVFGGKISYSLLDDLKAGLSVVSTDDSERVNDTDELYDITTYALDWEYTPIPGLTVTGESSFADTTYSASSTAANVDMDGSAHKLTATGDGGPSRVTLEYERVSPDYRTVVGSATPDREKAKFRWRYKYDSLSTITTGFLWYRNNLDGDLATRSDHYRPEISMLTRRVFGRKYASTDVSYKLDITEENKSGSRVDHIVNVNYRDRFGIFDSDSNIGFTSYEYKNAPRQKNKETTWNTSLSARFHKEKYILKPNLRLGVWTSRDELTSLSDKIYEYSLGTGFDIPSVKITSNIKIGQNKLEKDNGTDSLKGFARLDIFYRPEFLSGFQYGMIFLKAFINDYNYDINNNDFRETSVSTGVNIQF